LIQIKKLEREMKKARKAVEKAERLPIADCQLPIER
jgi:hypothetical protein